MSLFDFNRDDKTSLGEGMLGIGVVLGLVEMDAENDAALREEQRRAGNRGKSKKKWGRASKRESASRAASSTPTKAQTRTGSQFKAPSSAAKTQAQHGHPNGAKAPQPKKAKLQVKKLIFPTIVAIFLVGACLFGYVSSLVEKNPYSSYGMPESPFAAQEVLEELEEKLPYIGLKEELIDHSWLGKHDEYAEMSPDESYGRATAVYTWKSINGLNEDVFSAYVKDGEVVATVRHQPDSGYWPDDGTYKPDRRFVASSENASAVSVEKTEANSSSSSERVNASESATSQAPAVSLKPNFYDPMDYDSAEEYALDAEAWFASEGYADPWNSACAHWEASH